MIIPLNSTTVTITMDQFSLFWNLTLIGNYKSSQKMEVINDLRQIDKPITPTVSQTDPNDEGLSIFT